MYYQFLSFMNGPDYGIAGKIAAIYQIYKKKQTQKKI